MIENKKFLIKQGDKYYSIKDNPVTLLGIPIDENQKEQWFNDYGADDLKEVLLKDNNIQNFKSNSKTLIEGKLFTFNLDNNFKSINKDKDYKINDSIIFNYTGTIQQFVIPSYVSKLKLECYGSKGGNSYENTYIGIAGDYVEGVFNNSYEKSHILYIYVGGIGGSGGWGSSGGGAWYDGKTGGESSGGGGGSSTITLDNQDMAYTLIQAKGGDGGRSRAFAGGLGGGNNNFGDLDDGNINTKINDGKGKVIITVLDFNYKYLIKSTNDYIYTYDIANSNIVKSSSQALDSTNFKENGFSDPTLINEELWNNTFPDKTGLQLLKWTEDISINEDNIICNVETYKLIDSLDEQFEVRMMVPKG